MRCLQIFFFVKEGNRKRYIGFEITPANVFDKKDMINSIRVNCEKLLDKNFKTLGLFIIKFDGRQGIIRCKHVEKDNTIKLLKSIVEINNEKVKISTIKTSGTIKSLTKKHMKELQ